VFWFWVWVFLKNLVLEKRKAAQVGGGLVPAIQRNGEGLARQKKSIRNGRTGFQGGGVH